MKTSQQKNKVLPTDNENQSNKITKSIKSLSKIIPKKAETINGKTAIPSSSIINSTAINSEQTMMLNKRQFSGKCQQAVTILPSKIIDNRPIVIYCPSGPLQEIDANNRVLLTRHDIEMAIGTNFMQRYFGKYEPRIRCKADCQLLYYPPNMTDDEIDLTDPIARAQYKGQMVEKHCK